MSDYIDIAAFRAYVKTESTGTDANITSAITAASRAIDAYCGRRFYVAAETQYFRVDPHRENFLWLLPLDDMDIANTTGLVLATESGNDGTYPDTWTLNTDFILEPINQSQNGITGWPYTTVRAIGGRQFPFNVVEWQRPSVKITANFGWTAVPDAVVQATKILAAQYWALGGAPLGVAGWGAYGDIKVKDIQQARTLLAPFRKGQTIGIA